MPYATEAGARLMAKRLDVLLLKEDNAAPETSDAMRLRREILAMIRSALKDK